MSAERLRPGLAVLEDRYRVRVDDGVYAADGYLAGTDEQRAEALDRALRDPDVRAVFLARGGYGILRVLDRLDPAPLRRDPKPIVGFSDATALLCWALGRAGVAGIHGPVVAQLAKLPVTDRAWLFRLLEDPTPPGDLNWPLRPVGGPPGGVVRGPLVGGNLCLLSHLVGTAYQIDLGGAVVLVEEIGERPYKIDRYLTHLHLAGALAGVGALLVGDLHGCEETVGPPRPDAASVVGERLATFGLPGLVGAPVGHGARNAALPFGARCTADLDAHRLVLEQGAVA